MLTISRLTTAAALFLFAPALAEAQQGGPPDEVPETETEFARFGVLQNGIGHNSQFLGPYNEDRVIHTIDVKATGIGANFCNFQVRLDDPDRNNSIIVERFASRDGNFNERRPAFNISVAPGVFVPMGLPLEIFVENVDGAFGEICQFDGTLFFELR